MNWVDLEFSPPADPRDAWLRTASATQCEHRFRLITIPESQRVFHQLSYRSICQKCEAEA